MSWAPADPDLAARFDRALPDDPRVVRKRMFGFPSAFVGGHYVAGLHEARLLLRLPGGARSRFPELADAAPFVVPGGKAPVRDWCVVPPRLAADAAALAALLRGAIEVAAALPPKATPERKSIARKTRAPKADARKAEPPTADRPAADAPKTPDRKAAARKTAAARAKRSP